MKITLRTGNAYGQERIYITDPDVKRAVSTLTRRETLTAADLDALVNLGHELEWITC